jgi:hypothetical protein
MLAALLLLMSGSATPAGERPEGKNAEKICKVERELGSRIAARRVCMTRAEWSERAREMRDDYRQANKNKVSLGANPD